MTLKLLNFRNHPPWIRCSTPQKPYFLVYYPPLCSSRLLRISTSCFLFDSINYHIISWHALMDDLQCTGAAKLVQIVPFSS